MLFRGICRLKSKFFCYVRACGWITRIDNVLTNKLQHLCLPRGEGGWRYDWADYGHIRSWVNIQCWEYIQMSGLLTSVNLPMLATVRTEHVMDSQGVRDIMARTLRVSV